MLSCAVTVNNPRHPRCKSLPRISYTLRPITAGIDSPGASCCCVEHCSSLPVFGFFTSIHNATELRRHYPAPKLKPPPVNLWKTLHTCKEARALPRSPPAACRWLLQLEALAVRGVISHRQVFATFLFVVALLHLLQLTLQPLDYEFVFVDLRLVPARGGGVQMHSRKQKRLQCEASAIERGGEKRGKTHMLSSLAMAFIFCVLSRKFCWYMLSCSATSGPGCRARMFLRSR